MSITFQPTAPTQSSYQLQPIQDDPKASWGASIRGFLFGKVCKDWESSALMAASVAKVFLAVLNIFWGTFLMSAFFLLTAGIDAIAVRKLRNFASWNRNLQEHHKNNDFQSVLLFKSKLQLQDLTKNNAQYREHNDRLERQLGTHEDLVHKQGEQVALHSELNQELGQHARMIGQNLPLLDQMIANAHGHERTQLEELRKLAVLAKETHDKNAAISATQEQLNLSNTELLSQAQNIAVLLQTTDQQLVANIGSLRQDVEALRAAIASGHGQVEALQRVSSRLEGEVLRNAQLTGQNAERAQQVLGQVLQATTGNAGRATGRVGGNVHGFA